MPASRDHVKTIFGQAAEIALPDDRSRFLDEACSGNPALRAEVEDLLASMSKAGDFLVPCHFTDQTIDSPMPERPGTIIGPYKLLQQIGEGGMGVVYMAEQSEPVQRRVALKIIKPGMDSRQVIARFEAERQALALMDHPNIARVLDAGATESGRPFFVMELVKGVPITKYCDEKHLNLRQRLELMIPVCQAVQHAHQKGIIHRDIKPTNVLIAQYDGRPVPKVIDFGVAKATAQKLTERTMFTELGQVVGTIEYMSPEQAELNQLDIDTRSDIYSLGVLLYELLTGSTPFDKQQLRTAAFHEMLRIIREDEPPKPSTKLSTIETLPSVAANRSIEPARLSQSIRGELDWIVMKALEKDRSRRYESANGFAADIQRYLADEPVSACPPSAVYRLRKFARRNKVVAAALAAAAAFVVVIAAFGIRQSALAASRRVALNQARTANDALQANQRELQQNLYRADTDLAYQAWHAGLADRTVELLERHRPQASKDDIRGFEWFHLWRRSHDNLWNLRYESRPSILFSHSNAQLALKNDIGELLTTGWIRHTRWREGKQVDQFGNPIENYRPEPPPKRSPPKGDTRIRLYDSRRGTLQKTLSYPSESIGDAVFSYDDNTIAFRTYEGLVALNVTTGDVRAKRSKPITDGNAESNPPPIAASPTDPWIVTALDEENITLLDVQTLDNVRSWPAKKITRLAFSPNGKLIAGAGRNFQIVLWESASGSLKQTVRAVREPKPHELPESSPDLITFSPDGNVLAFVEGGFSAQQIVFWDIPSGARTKVEIKLASSSQRVPSIQNFHFVPQTNLIAACYSDGILRHWDLTSGDLMRQTPGFTGSSRLAISPDGKLLANPTNTELQVFERDVTAYRQVSPKRAEIFCAFQPGTNVLWTWQPSTGPQSNTPVRSWRASTRQSIASFPSFGDVLHGPQRLAISDDGQFAAIAADEKFSVFSGKKLADRRTFDAKVQSFECIAISPDQRFIATGGSRRTELGHSGNITLWDAKTLKPVFHMSQPWARNPNETSRWQVDVNEGYPEVRVVAFSPDGKQIATTGGTKEVCLWNVATGELQHELRIAQRSMPCLTFSPDGTLLAAVHDWAPERYTVKLCDPKSGEIVASLIGHTGGITGLAFSPDGKTLASAGDDGVRLWNVATKERVGLLDDVQTTFTSLSFSGDGKTLVAADRLGRLHFWYAAEQ